MKTNEQVEKFRQIVKNKFQIYNSLFMSLPYDKMTNIGMLLPFLHEESKEGYESGKSPMEVMQHFFDSHTDLKTEEERIDLLFRIIQYVERQVVLFDSIEDSAFSTLNANTDPGTVRNLYEVASQQGKLDLIKEKMEDFGVKVVFTAHPTQFYSNSVQSILHDLNQAIKTDSVTNIDMLLQQLGMTSFINQEKPTPYDEALSIIYYLRYVYYDTLGELYRDTKRVFDNAKINPHLFQLGFWPGGDRDGNPFVTAEITKRVTRELRLAILKCYYEHLKKLRKRLTFPKVTEMLRQISERVYQNIFGDKYDLTAEEFKQALLEIRQEIEEKNNGLFIDKLDDLIGRIDLFGIYFASLDIRQNSKIHYKALEQIFEKEFGKDYHNLDEQEKLELLLNTSLKIDPAQYSDDIVQDTINNIYQLKEIQQLNGDKSIHRYIISDSSSIYDVLNVYALFKYCGYEDKDIKLDIIPLFETIEGFTNAKATMDKLYNLPVYKEHLKRRGDRQFIMLGFSDGTKDAGYIKANWDIYTTKEILTKVSDENNIKVIFFDGRGGPPARGGGKTHQFYAAQGKSIANHQIELTIQGQTITSVFGTKDQATFNFEQLLTAGLENEIFPQDKINLKDWERELLNELANISYQKYKALKDHPLFVPYLEEVSTLKYYGRTNIGSRPSKRNNGQLVFEDLRAIPFVGSWSLLKQNVPGYFGVGTALQKIKEENRLDELKRLYKESMFFKTLIQNSMMSMSKTYFPLTYYLRNDKVFGEFWQILYNEYVLSHEMLLEIADYKTLMEEEPLSRSSIKMRENIVLPLLTIQQYALQKIKEENQYKETYEKIVTRALFGNINASRNSA
ncbi:phosphoenolpyruvate carboxylase [Elizabethkingia meningoseptica]|uniref:phosphoenolpyruvate carboxylase n=1 Tax=Elizabethkingia meningoseptica TaxID=238 RepID=UPI000332D2E9|nr:phosphoenolpyruvate carboxylase [Elizabethkingia meningoseptica]AQX06070.1 phosphoenolpyruvate carboxylase [Elizabethkingia meningoseptica]AQX48116.1 phosphoenolpyruvate carboxylase [Elizabethkingia meningoseptica]EOR31044.1 phosphoenolpyruvate carboxylase [Elizabethkingia meningoseptica ATCC 13253 = NBRC 12535]KUY23303.1 phosphoenolpyruvate carboxylase [Elizabethkingia meningoseptica]MDE5429702.1 phosphoenolpyruvate carboxylase [Elizabethkingia meningoseptica]